MWQPAIIKAGTRAFSMQVNHGKCFVETEGIWPAELSEQQIGSGARAVASVQDCEDNAALPF